jgi:tRNA(fMet)-specific endonuclease VapC
MNTELDKLDLIVDTDIFSFWFRGDDRGNAYQPYSFGKQLGLSFVTVGELYYWSLYHSWSQTRVNRLKQEISNYVILPSSDMVCRKFAEARIPALKKHNIFLLVMMTIG